MKDKRLFENKKTWMLSLLRLDMPYDVISKVLEISYETVYTYYIQLRKSKEWNEKSVPISRAKPQMVKLYADIMCIPSPPEFQDEKFKTKLKTVLAEVLEEEKIIQIIGYTLPAIMSFAYVKYANDVPEGYRRLIDELFPRSENPTAVWKGYLRKIAHSDAELPGTKQFIWKNKHFVFDIIEAYAEEIREHVAPIMTIRICRIIDEALKKVSLRDKSVIDLYYGLKSARKSFGAIREKFSISPDRPRQIKESVIKMLRNVLKDDIRPISHAWEEHHLLQNNHQKMVQQLQENITNQLLILQQGMKNE